MRPAPNRMSKGDHVGSITYRWTALVVAVLLAVAACGDGARERAEGEQRTADLVVGSAAAEWGLLTIPRAGGTPDLRPIGDPDTVVWSGQTKLPVARGAWPVGDAAAVVLAENGQLVRYDAARDDTTRLLRLSAEGRLAGRSASALVFVDSAGRFAYEVGADFAHAYPLEMPAAWVGPIDGGVAVLGTGGSPGLRLLPRADSGQVVEIPDAGRPPALVTAFGRRIVVTAPDGRAVRIFSTGEDAALVGEADVDGPIRALAASPSSHEIYAAIEDPPRLERISRFSLSTDELADLDAPADEIRPGLFGGELLVHVGAGIGRVRMGETRAVPLAGEWRADLPVGLPGDRTILLRDDEARLVSSSDSASGITLAGGSPRWWIPVRYNPSAGRAPDVRQALEGTGRPTGGEAAAPEGEPSRADSVGAEIEDTDMPQVSGEPERAREGPPGFYAIVASTRQREGVEALVGSLAEAGYPTRIQTYPDEAGQVWHRALVGPFPTRARAQAAARQLLRERDLQAWVTEIGVDE